MKVVSFRSLGAFALCALLMSMSSCAHDQQLVSIAVQPSTENFSLDAGLSVQLRALGTYIHPPVTKDITNQVTWASDDPQMVIVSPTGLITTTGLVCGSTLISATVNTNHSAGNRESSGAVVTATMTANVACATGGGTGPFLDVTVNTTGTATGTVTSSPGGISCPSTCIAPFMSGTAVTLTATPSGTATTVVWGNTCTVNPSNTFQCSLTLNGNTAVTATFQ
jgi:hypothetical protein